MREAEAVLTRLAETGLLLKQDKALPSVVGILTGESLNKSWWSHPKARTIFAVLSELADHPDILITKLVLRKDTLVHRSLWPALAAIASSRAPWQVQGLSAPAKRLLERLDRGDGPIRASGAPVKQLELRLLTTSHEVHTESGRHEMVLESWAAWLARVGCRRLRSVSQDRKAIEQATLGLGASLKSLPWPTSSAAAGLRQSADTRFGD